MPPRWGFSSFDVGGYNDVAPPELKNGSSAAASTDALIQQQPSSPFFPKVPEEREKLSCTARHSLIGDFFQRGQIPFPRRGDRERVRAEWLFDNINTA
jgi:hypothetical protein